LQAVIFDYDGVIADGFEANYLGWEKCFTEHGLSGFDRSFFRCVYGTGARNIARPILEKNNAAVSEEILLDLIRSKSQYAAEFASCITLIPGLIEFFNILHGFKLAIATGNSRIFIEQLNKHFGIDSYFDLVVGSEDVGSNRTDPKGLLIAASRLGAAPADCLVVEDAPLGVEAAKRCGMKCLALTTSKSRAALAAADLVADSYENIRLEDLTGLFRKG